MTKALRVRCWQAFIMLTLAKRFINSFTYRSHTCGQVSVQDVGRRVSIYGWVKSKRFNNKIIIVKDSYGSVQCVTEESLWKNSLKKTAIQNQSIVRISGLVRKRPLDQVNKQLANGDIEIISDQVDILNEANPTIENPSGSSKYRYLDLRSEDLQHALRFRSNLCRLIRQRLYDLHFVECETPTLYNRTPGGANEFIVPTQIPDQYYSLVQSPQQLKQLLMIGGLDRYFQICRCYRDESGRADRQPEFTQVDIELSFTNSELVMQLVDNLMHDVLTKVVTDEETRRSLLSSFDHQLRISKISFATSFEKYGTDKPDLRFDWLIETTSDGGLIIEIPHDIDLSTITMIINQATENCLTGEFFKRRISVDRQPGHGFHVKTVDNSDDSREHLGRIRNAVAKHLEREGKNPYRESFKFVWVDQFPLFKLGNEGKPEPNHHPFTAPTQESLKFLKTDPCKVVGQHYDLVLNGQEIAGGSIRIHDAQLQRRIFEEVLNLNPSTFNYFIEALSTGCPPHGGIAIGLDRLVAILLRKESIKDVIAFPKTNTGRDLLVDCPEKIGDDVKRLYHMK